MACVDRAEEPQDRRLVTAFPMGTREVEGTLSEGMRLCQTIG